MLLPFTLLSIVVAFAAGFAAAWWWQLQQARARDAVHEAERRLLDAQREQERQRADKHTEEKLQLLTETRGNLKQEFENLANRIFEDKQQSFHQQSGQRLDSVLNPLREQLTSFHKKVEDVYDKESKERSSLIGEIRVLKELNQQISQDAINLTQALKGDNKAQGNWGEMVLESILEKSGLVKGREYETQVSLKDDEGSRRVPDVIVHLPEGKDIIIDSKMVLVDYNRYCSAKTDDDKQQALRAHTQAIKNHINGLSVKAYEHLDGVRSLDFVLLFIPIEAAFMLAVENDPEIFRSAFDKGIIVVSPTTLLATLRTVQSIWRYEKQNKNAERIANEAGKLFDQFVLVLESLGETGKHLERAQASHDETLKRLSSGRGNLVGRIENLEKLGAKTKKQIPSEIKELSDDYSEEVLPEPEKEQ
jgi:DNA recombination protein RmuC